MPVRASHLPAKGRHPALWSAPRSANHVVTSRGPGRDDQKHTKSQPSDISAIVGPVQQGLPLTRSAKGITWLAVLFDLRDVSSKRFPSFDLALVLLRHPSAHEVSAIPLKPAAGIIGVKPTVSTPHR